MTKTTTKSDNSHRRYAPGTSRGPRNTATLLLQMAREAALDAERGARIRQLRGRKTQLQVALDLDVTPRAYQAWEYGGDIRSENARKLADYFGVSEEFIFYGDDPGRQPKTQMDRVEQLIERNNQMLEAILDQLGLTQPDDGLVDPRELAAQAAEQAAQQTGRQPGTPAQGSGGRSRRARRA